MNASTVSPSAKSSLSSLNWRDDLNASRNLSRNEVQAFGFVVGWFEDWRVRMNLPPGGESAREFWRVAVKSQPRQDWQMSQWAEGMRWYLARGRKSLAKVVRKDRRETRLARPAAGRHSHLGARREL